LKSDIQIARECKPLPISEVAARAGIAPERLEPYGKYKAKITPANAKAQGKDKSGKLVLVTAINPTPLGEGKTTVSIGLADGLAQTGSNVIAALREPSLGPVFGVKGGAAGGGYAQAVPMDEINLHFTGDLHAVTAANNLLSAIIDNHVFQGNVRRINPARVVFRRCQDVNDRALRTVVTGMGGANDGVTMKSGFDITAASEVMAVLCLADGYADLEERLGSITAAYDYDGNPVYARDLKAHRAMAVLLKDALSPNLVQTLEGTPVLMHGGPFANIAHGCNSVTATKLALSLADYCVTEAGFGADLGAEKFLDVKCRAAGIQPSCVVLVATIKALKYSGGAQKNQLTTENLAALNAGMCNLEKHIENITTVFGLPCVVAINRFAHDTDAEIAAVVQACERLGAAAEVTDAFAKGGAGSIALAKKVKQLCELPSKLKFAYAEQDSLIEKLKAVVTKVYGGAGVQLSAKAKSELARIEAAGLAHLPVIIAKTQYSLSDDPKLLGRPQGFTVKIADLQLRSGAGFVVARAGDIMLMPGLPAAPLAESIYIDENGQIEGLS